MKRKIIIILVCMLLIATVLPATATVDDEENLGMGDKSDYVVCGSENFNLIVTVKAVRKFFPRSYMEDAYGDFEILFSNEGPDDCNGCTVELKYYALLGYEPGELKRDKIEIGTIPANGEHSEIIHHHFGSLSPVGLFVTYKLQATVNIDDLEQADNSASFIYIVVGF